MASGSLVSIVIPTYNRAETVRTAIDSVLEQDYQPMEVIVVDDGSTDDTTDVLVGYGDQIRLIKQANRGVSAARNLGVAAANGEYIAFLDSDDIWLPGKLTKQMAAFEDNRVVFSYTNWAFGHTPCQPQIATAVLELAAQGNGIVEQPVQVVARPDGGGVMLQGTVCRKQAFYRVGSFDERMSVAEDTRLIYRMACEGAFAIVPDILFQWRRAENEDSLTRTGDPVYRRKHSKAVIEILFEMYARMVDLDAASQRQVRRLLGHFLVRQAKELAEDRRYNVARRRAIEALAMMVRGRDAGHALLALALPQFYAWRGRSGERKGDGI